MPDNSNTTPEHTDDNPDIPPSTLFLEMMRRAAARRVDITPDDVDSSDPQPVSPPTPPAEPELVTGSDAPGESDTPPDTQVSQSTQSSEISSSDDDAPLVQPDPLETPAFDKSASRPAKDFSRRSSGKPYLPPLNSHLAQRKATDQSQRPSEPPAQPVPGDSSGRIQGSTENTTRRTQMPVYQAPLLSDEERASRLQEQRVRRVRRRQQRRQQRRAGMIGGFLRTVFIVIFAAGLASTIFTWFTRPDFIRQDVASGLQSVAATATPVSVAVQPTAIPTPNWMRRIGIVAGHHGPENDPGAICPDGLTEVEINFDVAQRVGELLRQRGYNVSLLDEFDPRLDNYQAEALVSIHANTCQDFGEYVSGFMVAKAAARPEGGVDTMLAECIAEEYGVATGLERRINLTLDMTDYHTFREIHPLTPAAILELGFMKDDRDLLVNQQDRLAEGIVAGIECFLALESSPGARIPGSASPSPAEQSPAAEMSATPMTQTGS